MSEGIFYCQELSERYKHLGIFSCTLNFLKACKLSTWPVSPVSAFARYKRDTVCYLLEKVPKIYQVSIILFILKDCIGIERMFSSALELHLM